MMVRRGSRDLVGPLPCGYVVIEVIPTTIAAVTALDVAGALVAHRAGQRSAAQVMNGVALAITCAGSLVALAQSGGANANAPGVALLAALVGLTALCFYSARKSAMPSFVFWLAWSVNLAIVVALVYLLFWFKIF